MRVVKFNAWETPFGAFISAIRLRESRLLQVRAWLYAFPDARAWRYALPYENMCISEYAARRLQRFAVLKSLIVPVALAVPGIAMAATMVAYATINGDVPPAADTFSVVSLFAVITMPLTSARTRLVCVCVSACVCVCVRARAARVCPCAPTDASPGVQCCRRDYPTSCSAWSRCGAWRLSSSPSRSRCA